jgi:hypothetical protein
MIFPEIESVLTESQTTVRVITEEDILHLPKLLQIYLKNIGFVGSHNQYNTYFYYTGDFKLNDNSDWADVAASTYVTGAPLSRNYLIELNSPLGKMSGFDTYYNGDGHMSIRHFSGLSFMEEDGPKFDISELVTILADFPVCPGLFLLNNFTWEEVNDTTLKVTISDAGMQCSGYFYFNEQGLIHRFVSNDRYKNEEDEHTTEWIAFFNRYKLRNDILVPTYMEGGWNYETGIKLYAKVNLKEVEYNINSYR